MDALHLNPIEAVRAGFGALGAKAMADRFLGVLGHQLLELGLGPLVLAMGRAGPQIARRTLGPQIGRGHVDHLDRCEPRPRSLDVEQDRWLAALDAAPELSFGGQQQVLVQRVGVDLDRDPLAAAGDESRAPMSETPRPTRCAAVEPYVFRRRLLQ
ncbi:hypothetical protein ACVIIW_006854 [Bradyrhizobium sp. USDA 4449]